MVAMLSLAACTTNEHHYSYQAVGQHGWSKDSALTFDVRIDDAALRYNLYLYTRNSHAYPYQNLWLFLDQKHPNGVQVADSVNFYLADDFGKWLGSGIGALYTMPVLYKQNFVFAQTGTYSFRIRHGMRDSLLVGLADVGFKVEISE